MAAAPWWVVWYQPIGPRAPGTAHSRFVIVQAAKKSDITAASIGGGAIETVDGPFDTKADAQKDAGKGPVPGTGKKTNAQTSALSIGIPNPLSGLAAIGAALAKLVGYLSDLAMWRSLGWLLLGAVMVILGIILWLKKDNYLPSAVPVPV